MTEIIRPDDLLIASVYDIIIVTYTGRSSIKGGLKIGQKSKKEKRSKTKGTSV